MFRFKNFFHLTFLEYTSQNNLIYTNFRSIFIESYLSVFYTNIESNRHFTDLLQFLFFCT